jgi:hypothetical protein
VGGALAIAYILNFPELKEAALERMSHSMNEKIIADCYKSATRVGKQIRFLSVMLNCNKLSPLTLFKFKVQ